MQFAIDKVGRCSEEQEYRLAAERTKQYAAATNAPIPVHATGELAPPVFSVVPVWDVMGGAVGEVTPAEAFPFVVHGEQDMYFHQPIVPGMVLRSRAAPIGIHVTQSGTTVVSRIETRDASGELVNEQYTVTFFRGVTGGEGSGQTAPEHRLPQH